MSRSPSSIMYLGASRGVAYHAYTDLAKRRPEVQHILLLRDVASFKSRTEFTSLSDDVIKRTTLVEGDAWNPEDIKQLIHNAGKKLEAIVYTLGPHDHTSVLNKLLHGIIIEPKDAATRGIINVINALATLSNSPKLVFVSSYGMGERGLANLGFITRWLYKYYLVEPHADKIASELAIVKASKPSSTNPAPHFFPEASELPLSVLSRASYDVLPTAILDPSQILIVRPSAFIDGPAKGYGTYRVVQDGVGVSSRMTIPRAEVGEFISAALCPGGVEGAERWFGHQVVFQN